MKELFCPFCGSPMGEREIDWENNQVTQTCDTCWSGVVIPIVFRYDLMEIEKGENVE
jgi:hypothetical protein